MNDFAETADFTVQRGGNAVGTLPKSGQMKLTLDIAFLEFLGECGAVNSNQSKSGYFQKDLNLKINLEQESFMKFQISCDEEWPVFSIEPATEKSEIVVEVPEDLYRDYLCTMIKYCKYQEKLKVYYDEGKKGSKAS